MTKLYGIVEYLGECKETNKPITLNVMLEYGFAKGRNNLIYAGIITTNGLIKMNSKRN